MPALMNLLYDHFSIKLLTFCSYLNMNLLSLIYNSYQLLKTAELFLLHVLHSVQDCHMA